MDEQGKKILERIKLVRTQHFGERGRAKFAKALGISPSTYNYYERNRLPSPSLLVKICMETSTDLRWLLTGETSGKLTREDFLPLSGPKEHVVPILGRTAAYKKNQVSWDEMMEANEKLDGKLQGLKA